VAIITLVVYRWQMGAGALAALSLAVLIPSGVLGPLAGVWADRWPRRTVMVICDLGRCIVIGAMFWAPNLPVILTLVVAKGAFSALFNPARDEETGGGSFVSEFLAGIRVIHGLVPLPQLIERAPSFESDGALVPVR
jgi:MFS family permease